MSSMNTAKSSANSLLSAVRNLIEIAKFNKSFRATVTEKINNTVYKVSYKNIDYKVKSYYNLVVGDVVWVCAPKNDWDSLFVQSYSGFQDRVITTDNIVNNYTTNVAGTVLDGRVGKDIKTEIDGIKTSLTTLNSNLNALSAASMKYQYFSGTVAAGVANGGIGFVAAEMVKPTGYKLAGISCAISNLGIYAIYTRLNGTQLRAGFLNYTGGATTDTVTVDAVAIYVPS